MYINPEYIAGIVPVLPQGTNSTMFTECCECAICDNEPNCPICKRKVIGWDETQDRRRKSRWQYATRTWNRKKYPK